MRTYVYRVYLDGAMYADIQIQATCASQGQLLAESQYAGRRVQYMYMI